MISDGGVKRRREQHDRQIMRCPAQVIILCEAIASVDQVLRHPAVAADIPGAPGLNGRPTFEHYMVRGEEKEAAVLIGARKDNCSYLNLLDYHVNLDGRYTQNKKEKRSKTRMLTCKVGFKQNVGHLGRSS